MIPTILCHILRRVVVSPNIEREHWRKKPRRGKVAKVSRELIPPGDPMLRLSDSARSSHTADGAVVLDVKRGRMFRFNLTGSRIWQLLQSGAEERDIPGLLVRELSADPATAAADTEAFIESLRQHALAEPR